MIALEPVIVVAAFAFAGAGCHMPMLSTVDRNIRFGASSPDALVVFGFPAGANAWLRPGVDDGVNWHCQPGLTGVQRVRTENGFIVAKLSPRTGKQKYAIAGVASDSTFGQYRPGPNSGILVFNAEPGKVTYLGTLRGVRSGGVPALVQDPSVPLSVADDFVTRTFPNIRDHVVPGRMDWVYTGTDGCS